MPRTTVKKEIIKTEVASAAQDVGDTTARAVAEAAQQPKKTYKVKKDLPLNSIITVRNGFNGRLVYVSSRTRERFVWDAFGDEQDMELQELRNARNSNKKFFENNWFLIDDPEVIEFLNVQQYYKNALTYDNFDDLFSLAPESVKKRVGLLSDGQKLTVKCRAKQLIADGAIDSMKVISALEESLGVELIER